MIRPPLRSILPPLAAILLLGGCAWMPWAGGDESEAGTEPAEERGGEERDSDPEDDDTIDLGEVFGGFSAVFGAKTTGDASPEGDGSKPFNPPESRRQTDDAEEQAGVEQEMATLRAQAEGRAIEPPPVHTERSEAALAGPALGVVFEQSRTPRSEALLAALRRAAPDYPLSLVEPGVVDTELRRLGCGADATTDCLAALSRDAGIRVLVSIAALAVDDDGAEATVRLAIADTAFGDAADRLEMVLPVRDGRIPATALDALASAVYTHAAERIAAAPLIVHALDRLDDDTWLLNQGREAGVEAGMTLSIHPRARMVHGPGGAVRAWLPGTSSGRLEVVDSGPRSAVARLISGDAPAPDNYLVPDEG